MCVCVLIEKEHKTVNMRLREDPENQVEKTMAEAMQLFNDLANNQR